MREYEWPGNYSQLKRVLNELAAITPFGYINSNDMAEIITRERSREKEAAAPAETISVQGRTL